jgi:hypothetical protein
MADWYPAEHTYTGESDGRLVLPHYDTLPTFVRVYDTGVRTSGWKRWQRKLWRKARTLALGSWEFPFAIIEKKDRELYLPQGITLKPQDPDPLSSNNYGGFGLAPIEHPSLSDYDEPTWLAGKGFALIHPQTISTAFAGRNIAYLKGAICHEVGHALGFGHGGTGVMESKLNPPYEPNDEEIEALKAYWF